MVVTALPAASLILVWQLRTAAPSTCTVHAPHMPIPQPYLVPVRSATSRRNHSSGMSGSPSNCRPAPLTLSWIIYGVLLVQVGLRGGGVSKKGVCTREGLRTHIE